MRAYIYVEEFTSRVDSFAVVDYRTRRLFVSNNSLAEQLVTTRYRNLFRDFVGSRIPRRDKTRSATVDLRGILMTRARARARYTRNTRIKGRIHAASLPSDRRRSSAYTHSWRCIVLVSSAARLTITQRIVRTYNKAHKCPVAIPASQPRVESR